jgi:3-hydroxyacyl-[acyl-carrier-protein] dehydratase
MPLATFEGSIRVGQEKAVLAEEITLTFGYAAAAADPAPVTAAKEEAVRAPAVTATPLAAAINA